MSPKRWFGATRSRFRPSATFSVREKGGRVGRNPKTGEEVPIEPRRVLVFRPSHILKNKINDNLSG